MTGLRQDFRFAFRSLAKDRRFSLLSILALALGIGASTVIFSAVYGVILNTFPFRDADQVTSFGIQDLENPSQDRRESLSIPEFLDYREQTRAFSDISGEYGGFGSTPVVYTAGDSTYQFSADFMSANSFTFFGVNPVVGRMVTEEDTKPGATPVFMMSYKLWRQQFDANPRIVGTSFTLNGVSRTLVGIMPPRFRWGWAEIWVPFPLDRGQIAADPELARQYVWCVGRLRPGVSLRAAEANLDVVAHQLAKIHPDDYPKRFTVTATRLTDRVVGPFKSLIYPLLGAVLLLLLIACANVANLLLARATVREKEIAVRAAVGASRARLVRQFLVESLVLASLGCVAGCMLAYAGIRALVPLIPYDVFPQEAVIELNSRVLLFSLGIAVLTTFLCGLAPAYYAIRRDVQARLMGTGKGVNSDFSHGKGRSALVVAEVALCMVLLIGAGLMIHTFFGLTHVELGFNPEHVLAAHLPLPASSYKTAAQRKLFRQQILQRVRALPGVTAAGEAIATPPYSAGESVVTVPGKTHADKWLARIDLVSDGYFQAVSLRLLRGRLLTSDDMDSDRAVVVVNQALARKFFENEDPIGKQIKFEVLDQVPDTPHDTYFEIVGVVSDARNHGLQNEVAPEGYLPSTISGVRDRVLLIRTAMNPEALVAAIRHEVWAVDSHVALADAGSLQSILQRSAYAFPQFELTTLATFAAIGLLLVIIGVFSVMAYTVSLQTHELGVRIALGAQKAEILTLVLRKGLVLIAAGILVGVLASYGLTHYLAHSVWGIAKADPWTFVAVATCVAVVGLAACYVPARRAANVDPMVALRYE
jgi:putative ABC transport system permease protein